MDDKTVGAYDRAIIKVIGVGDGGTNAIESMIASNLHDVDFIAANTDVISLRGSKVKIKIQLGNQLTRGLDSGTKPEIGKEAAKESRAELTELFRGTDLLVIVAGMGGGTGTGAAPVIAEAAREAGILTVGIVTKPFMSEGKAKMDRAAEGIDELKKYVDSLIVISNDRLIIPASNGLSLIEAFKPANEVLRQAVQCISELIMSTGLIGVDFADVKSVMSVRGMAMMGLGVGKGEDKASMAIHMAISSPMLEDIDISKAKGILVNITGSSTMTMDDYATINCIVSERINEDARITIGLFQDDNVGDLIKLTVIATGFESDLKAAAPFQKKHFYSWKQQGSHSIKAVLPAFVAGMDGDWQWWRGHGGVP